MRSISVFCFVALFSIFLDAQVSEDVRRINVSDLNMENIYEPDRMETDLLVAAALGPTEGLKRYINLIGGEVNGITRLGETVLTELVEYLDLKYTPGDFHERFGVHYDRALILRNIKVLVDAGLEMDARNENGETALIKSIRKGYFEGREARYIKKLIELGADPNAVVAGEQSILQRVLNFYDQQTESFDDGGRSKRMAEKRIRFLLLNGADVSENQAQQVIDILGQQEFQKLAKSRKLKASTLKNCYNAVPKVGS